MDVLTETWTYRDRYIKSGIMSGPPHQGICRGCKVGKEEVLGLLVALQLYLARDHEADLRLWWVKARYMAENLGTLPSIHAEVITTALRPIPQIRLFLDEQALGFKAADLVNQLLGRDPMIAVGQGLIRDGIVMLSPMCLEDGEEEIVVEKIRQIVEDSVTKSVEIN